MSDRSIVAIAILIFNDRIVITRHNDRDDSWAFPGARVVAGEEIKEAAARVAQAATGIAINPERFDTHVREQLGRDGVLRISYQAELTYDEYRQIPRLSPCGTRDVLMVREKALGHYIRDRNSRILCTPG